MLDLLAILAVFLIGFIPAFLWVAIRRKVRSLTRERLHTAMRTSSSIRPRRSHPCLHLMEYKYVEGVGYMLGDITCKFNARSAYLRCAINPSGPCKGCSCYESIEFKELGTRS